MTKTPVYVANEKNFLHRRPEGLGEGSVLAFYIFIDHPDLIEKMLNRRQNSITTIPKGILRQLGPYENSE